MKANRLLLVVGFAGFGLGACATTVPSELVHARAAYRRAAQSEASQVVPADVHVAHLALARAEKSFKDDDDSPRTRDLAYVAMRRAELAQAKAAISIQAKATEQAKKDLETAQGQVIDSAKEGMNKMQAELGVAAEKIAAEQAARLEAERRAAEAMAALAKLAAVKEDPRGTVITLLGSVLFSSNQSVLMAEARSQLDQVADVLLATRERRLTIEGHTDSRSTATYNLGLSQKRADAVREYLVQRGYEADLITAIGMGEAQPVASNGSGEGRANNRRVEIIIDRETHTSIK